MLPCHARNAWREYEYGGMALASASRFGEAGVKGAGGGGGGAGFQDFGDFSPFGDIFETFFGGGGGGGGGRRRQQGPQQGDDLRLDLEIDFMTAVFGGEEKIRISHLETCDTCDNVRMRLRSAPWAVCFSLLLRPVPWRRSSLALYITCCSRSLRSCAPRPADNIPNVYPTSGMWPHAC